MISKVIPFRRLHTILRIRGHRNGRGTLNSVEIFVHFLGYFLAAKMTSCGTQPSSPSGCLAYLVYRHIIHPFVTSSPNIRLLTFFLSNPVLLSSRNVPPGSYDPSDDADILFRNDCFFLQVTWALMLHSTNRVMVK